MADVSNLTISKLPGCELTVKVRLAKRFLWRLHVGLWLIKLGAKVTPFNVKVETY